MVFSRRVRVGELCSLLFLPLFQPHVFQVCFHKCLKLQRAQFASSFVQSPCHILLTNTRSPVPRQDGTTIIQQSTISGRRTAFVSSPFSFVLDGILTVCPAATQSSAYSYSSYDAHDNRYPAQPNYQTYPSRTSPTLPDTTVDSRKLPPLSTSQAYGRDDRWSTASYTTVPSHAHGVSQVRSPTASYPATYNAPYPSTNPTGYGYGAPMTDPRSHTSMHSISPQSHSSLVGAVPDPRASSPYGRGSSHVPPSSYTPPPISPTSGDEPTIKKKRKRADAAQLKILTETYARTAFPSTEERLELAKLLDMTPRSVQIWYYPSDYSLVSNFSDVRYS